MPRDVRNNVLRLLVDPPLDGPTNMARDEALLTLVGRREAPPTLRLYQWAPPTVSLGYFQSYAEFLTQPPAVRAMPVVRRLTGGGAIIHRDELTYSLTLPTDHPLLAANPIHLYERVHDAAINVLAVLGIVARRAGGNEPANARRGRFLCFERRHCLDVVVGPLKVLGSAQRRTADAILQHGSLQLAEVALPDAAHARLSRWAEDPSCRAKVASAFVDSLSAATAMLVERSDWDAAAARLAAETVAKYAGVAWTQLR